jgi:diaminobutyrate-2-oxoglutarate transaminase
VLGDDDLEVTAPGEIRPSHEFYDFEAKYLDDSELVIPADVPPRSPRIDALAREAYRAIGCRAWPASTSSSTRRRRAVVNEINTIPGFTPNSMFPRLWAAEGLAYPALVDRLLELALDHPHAPDASTEDPSSTVSSEVRSYCRNWPATFERARGSELWDTDGRRYLDFFAGAGALNYGHNDPVMRDAVIDHLTGDGIVHSLDAYTVAKERFLERFEEVILKPRGMDHKVQFPGPTGTNAVEAAMKLARKVTGREHRRLHQRLPRHDARLAGGHRQRDEAQGAGVMLARRDEPALRRLLRRRRRHRSATSRRCSRTAAAASTCRRPSSSRPSRPRAAQRRPRRSSGCSGCESSAGHDVLLIVDDIQAGCGRTGRSSASSRRASSPTSSPCRSRCRLRAAVRGDPVPPDLDVWDPGEHNGTFRGHNPAFVTATDDDFAAEIARKGALIERDPRPARPRPPGPQGERRGRGMIQGLACAPGLAGRIVAEAFELGLIVETSGPRTRSSSCCPP